MGFLQDPISVEPQTSAHPYWCWASITAAVWTFFEKVTWTMPQVVVLALQPDCSGQFQAEQGEHEWPLASALSLDNQACLNTAHNHLASDGTLGPVDFTDLGTQIDSLQSPVCVALTFATPVEQSTHYCLINGVFMQDGEPWISLLDPAGIPPGEQRMAFSDLASGTVTLESSAAFPAAWTDTFYTK